MCITELKVNSYIQNKDNTACEIIFLVEFGFIGGIVFLCINTERKNTHFGNKWSFFNTSISNLSILYTFPYNSPHPRGIFFYSASESIGIFYTHVASLQQSLRSTLMELTSAMTTELYATSRSSIAQCYIYIYIYWRYNAFQQCAIKRLKRKKWS